MTYDLEPEEYGSTYSEQMRAIRGVLLATSDWTQLPDAPCDRQAWADYRQTLRDFPASWVPGPVADFPEPPSVVL